MKRSMIILLGAALVAAMPAVAAQDELPNSAKPGECYARVFTPATYSTSSERVLRDEGGEKIEIVPARYETATEIMLAEDVIRGGKVVHRAGTTISAGERPMTERLEAVPAQYEWVSEKVLVKPAQTVWKKGSGPIQKIDNHTGEIMCLVEEPAVYETVRKRVLKTPATTRIVSVPASTKSLTVRKLISAPSERRVTTPAEYTTLTKRTLVSDGRMDWKPVLCQTNLSKDVVISLQRALSNAGFNPGSIDGVIGSQTMTAVRSYQRSKGLASGALTMETLDALKIRIGG